VPTDPIRWTWLLGLDRALIHLGRDAEAVGALRLAVASNPAFARSHALLAAALALAGEAAPAWAAMAEFRRTEPDIPLDGLARYEAQGAKRGDAPVTAGPSIVHDVVTLL
jgi:hypothetical protein